MRHALIQLLSILQAIHPKKPDIPVGYWEKLWNRGVDIGVNVVSGLLLAAIAGVVWFIKQELSLLYHGRQVKKEAKIHAELGRANTQRVVRELYNHLSREHENLIKQAKNISTGLELRQTWLAYQQWAGSNQLITPELSDAWKEFDKESKHFQYMSDEPLEHWRAELCSLIHETSLPQAPQE